MYYASFSRTSWRNYSWMVTKSVISLCSGLNLSILPSSWGLCNLQMKQISSSFSRPLCFSADSICLLKAIQQCPAHWSGRGSVQCGGKWLSRGMIDLNSTMAAPKATQPPLRVMDARMSPITFSSGGKTLFYYQCRPHLSPPVVLQQVAERNEFCKRPQLKYIFNDGGVVKIRKK